MMQYPSHKALLLALFTLGSSAAIAADSPYQGARSLDRFHAYQAPVAASSSDDFQQLLKQQPTAAGVVQPRVITEARSLDRIQAWQQPVAPSAPQQFEQLLKAQPPAAGLVDKHPIHQNGARSADRSYDHQQPIGQSGYGQ